MLLRTKSACDTESLGPFTQRHCGKDTTVTRHRDDYNEALVKFNEAHKTAVGRGELSPKAFFWKDRVRQRSAPSQQQRTQQRPQSQQASMSADRPDAHDLKRTWWSPKSSSNFSTGSKTGTRRCFSFWVEISLTRGGNLHVREGRCKQYTAPFALLRKNFLAQLRTRAQV